MPLQAFNVTLWFTFVLGISHSFPASWQLLFRIIHIHRNEYNFMRQPVVYRKLKFTLLYGSIPTKTRGFQFTIGICIYIYIYIYSPYLPLPYNLPTASKRRTLNERRYINQAMKDIRRIENKSVFVSQLQRLACHIQYGWNTGWPFYLIFRTTKLSYGKAVCAATLLDKCFTHWQVNREQNVYTCVNLVNLILF